MSYKIHRNYTYVMLIMYVYIYTTISFSVSSNTKLLSSPPMSNPVFKDAQSGELSRAINDNSQSL